VKNCFFPVNGRKGGILQKFQLILDTETSYQEYKTKFVAYPIKPIWNIAWIIQQTNGKVIKVANYKVSEYFNIANNNDFSANKAKNYKCLEFTSWEYVENALEYDMESFSIDTIWAYNASFDFQRIQEMNTLIKALKPSFNPQSYNFGDIWKLAVTTQAMKSDYFSFCTDNGYITEKGNIKTDAETMYRFLTKDVTFKERHLALQDCRIETQIFNICKQSKAKTKSYDLSDYVWKIPQDKFHIWADKEIAKL